MLFILRVSHPLSIESLELNISKKMISFYEYSTVLENVDKVKEQVFCMKDYSLFFLLHSIISFIIRSSIP